MANQYNTNIAFPQIGGINATDNEAIVIGGREGRPTLHDYAGLRAALSNAGDPRYVGYFVDFVGDTDDATLVKTIGSGGSVALSTTTAGGTLTIATGATDDTAVTIALGTHWLVSNGLTFFEARIKSVTAITLRAIEVGLSDATTETNGLAFSNHAVGAVADVADNAAVFGYDTDASMTDWAINTVKAGTPAAVALDPSAAPSLSYQTLGIVVQADGDAWFYLDGVEVGHVENAVATTALLTPWVTLKTLSAADKSIIVDYVLVHGERV